MLGVSRPSVTLSAEALQTAGLISYHRGNMTIVDRAGLKRASCECYEVVHARLTRLSTDGESEP
jgi:Mn-dependent DtxR family transcriptional regulator